MNVLSYTIYYTKSSKQTGPLNAYFNYIFEINFKNLETKI